MQQSTTAQRPPVPPLITRAAHPALRREAPSVVTEAVRRARERQAHDSSSPATNPGRGRAAPVIPANLASLLGLTGARDR